MLKRILNVILIVACLVFFFWVIWRATNDELDRIILKYQHDRGICETNEE